MPSLLPVFLCVCGNNCHSCRHQQHCERVCEAVSTKPILHGSSIQEATITTVSIDKTVDPTLPSGVTARNVFWTGQFRSKLLGGRVDFKCRGHACHGISEHEHGQREHGRELEPVADATATIISFMNAISRNWETQHWQDALAWLMQCFQRAL